MSDVGSRAGAAEPRVRDCARAIFFGFARYNDNFGRITRRARERFVKRDWRGGQRDLADRIDLYEKSVRRIVTALERQLGAGIGERAMWIRIKHYFGERIETYPDANFAKTFFSSVTRRVFDTVGTDPEIEFVGADLRPTTSSNRPVECRTYINWGSIEQCAQQLLADADLGVAYADAARSARRIAAEVEARAAPDLGGVEQILQLEFIAPVFYQSTRAYLVGRMHTAGGYVPLLVALENTGAGIVVDAVITTEDEVSILFGFTRSYFFVDLHPVGGAVGFLTSILPKKSIDEIYTILGRAKQGKTERYRSFTRHLRSAPDRFVRAPGARGLVMVVFTLPSSGLVFKVIRDRFGPPKTIAREDVIAKYDLVFKHDRAGRLIDTQEFRHLEFPVGCFDPELLEELLEETAHTTRVAGNRVVIDHLYIERCIRPLNLHLGEVGAKEAEHAVLDYGQAIRDLAMTNIFPGDLLLKNFGVTRHGRVIFYDYDEVCLVTECRFRELPEPRSDEEALHRETWFPVARNDVFPGEFGTFLGLGPRLKSLFTEVHGELLAVPYWRSIQARHRAEEFPEVVPYHRVRRR